MLRHQLIALLTQLVQFGDPFFQLFRGDAEFLAPGDQPFQLHHFAIRRRHERRTNRLILSRFVLLILCRVGQFGRAGRFT